MDKLKIRQIFRDPKDKVRNQIEIDGYPNFSFYTDLSNENLVQFFYWYLIINTRFKFFINLSEITDFLFKISFFIKILEIFYKTFLFNI